MRHTWVSATAPQLRQNRTAFQHQSHPV